MYAIIDIETTGGKYNEESITEIAIYRYHNNKIVDQFSSLVNPQKQIQPFVEKLTGINQKMLITAPKFHEIAKRIIEITDKSIIVAHNAQFDYRILQTEFIRLGYRFKLKSICTVKLSKEIFPNLKSYKLGKLVKSLGIPIKNRHRARGDALATLKLFELLLKMDINKEILKTHVKELITTEKKNDFSKIIMPIPTEIGNYYFINNKSEIFFIGKSKNIKKRVIQHLTGNTKKDLKIQKLIKTIKYETTGNELISILKEKNEIEKTQPILNKSKIKNSTFGIRIDYDYLYHRLIIEKINNDVNYLKIFENKNTALSKLKSWIDKFSLCTNYTSIGIENKSCDLYNINKCKGACMNIESSKIYNLRLNSLYKHLEYQLKDFLLIDKGISDSSKSFIWIENYKLKGYGYFNLNFQITNIKTLNKLNINVKNTIETKNIIKSYIKRKKYLKLISL